MESYDNQPETLGSREDNWLLAKELQLVKLSGEEICRVVDEQRVVSRDIGDQNILLYRKLANRV